MDDPGSYAYSAQPQFDPTAYQQQLDFYKKYDPNATVTGQWNAPTYSGGDAPAMVTSGNYTPNYSYDQSKVPKIGGTAFTEDDRQYLMPMDEMGTGRNLSNYKLYDPKLVYNDPVYGRVTDIRNVDQRDGFDWIGTLGPMIAGGAAGLAGAGMAGTTAMGLFNAAKGFSEGGSWQKILGNAALGMGAGYLGGQIGAGLDTGSVSLPTGGSFNPGNFAGSTIAGGLKAAGSGYLSNQFPNQATPNPISAVNRSSFQGNNNMAYPTYPDGGATDVGQIVPPVNVTASRDPTGGGVPNEGWPPGMDPSQGGGGGGGGFNPLSFVGGAINSVTGNSGDPFGIGAAAGSAALNYQNQRDYQRVLDKYVPEMNPFGSQRAGYQTMLKKAWDDPTAVLNDPAHKAIQERQMAALSAKLGASGYMGSGLEKMNLADYLATSDNQFLGQEKDRLALLGGANIGPAAAAGLIGTATKGIMDSRSNMYADMTRALNPNGGSNPSGTRPGGSGGNPVSNAKGPGGGSMNPTDFAKLYPGSGVSGTDKYGNKIIVDAGGKAIGLLSQDGKTITPYSPGMSGETDTSGDAGAGYNSADGPPDYWQDPGGSNYTPDYTSSPDWYTESTGFLFND